MPICLSVCVFVGVVCLFLCFCFVVVVAAAAVVAAALLLLVLLLLLLYLLQYCPVEMKFVSRALGSFRLRLLHRDR